ncbi:carboxypeptidase-like regulatory domain-containing protein [Fodinibius sp. AD559]|uniref:carboxypeptidase-like regulatory domain-containing protein n=1 Tax=Fodinibius sp. AD559 TaxID=3424179 RepID=UPI004046A498
MVTTIGRIFIFFISIACICPSLLYGQTLIKGEIIDSLQQPIPHAQILLRQTKDSGIVAFTQSDSLGSYVLKVRDTGQFMLFFKALSYETKHLPLTISRDTLIRRDATLRSNPIVFDEIVVRSQGPIRVNGDTVAYKADDFTYGDEMAVEDLLQRLPGIEVEDDGTIKFGGKEVEKVMVENADLFGKGYSMITKNLGAGLIDEIQALQHYSDNPELKGLEHSDKVALNLELKEEVKTSLLGNATVGYNSSNDYEARLALIAMGKKVQQYSFLNTNSLGYDPLGKIDHYLYSERPGTEPLSTFDLDLHPILNLNQSSPGLRDSRVRFNNSSLASYNIIFNPSDLLEFKLLSFATFEKDRFNREGIYTYDTNEEPVVNREEKSLTERIKNGFSRIQVSYKPTDNSHLKYDGLLFGKKGDSRSTLTFNDRESSELLDNSRREMEHYLDFTSRINEKNALLLSGRYQYKQQSEKLSARPFLPKEVFGNGSPSFDADQRNETDLWLFNLQAKTITRMASNFTVEVKAGTEFLDAALKTDLLMPPHISSHNILDEGYTNNNDLGYENIYIGLKSRYNFGSGSIFGAADINRLAYNTTDYLDVDNDDTILKYIEPRLGLKWEINKKNTMQITYLYNATATSFFELSSNYLFLGDRTFSRGVGIFGVFRGHNYLFNYTLGDWIDHFFVNATVLYNQKKESLSVNSIITPEYRLLRKQQGGFEDLLHFSLSTDLYLKALRNNLKGKLGYSSTHSKTNEINGENYLFYSHFLKPGFELRSVFDGVFNYIVGGSWKYHRNSSVVRHSNIDLTQFLDLYFDLSDTIELQLLAERYRLGGREKGNNHYFLDGIAHYELSKNKWKIKFEMRNLLNNHQFEQYELTDVGTESTFHKIVSRYFLAGVHYRF